MARAVVVVLDSVGCGQAPDADRYGDAGADTLGHIAERCASGDADRAGLRAGRLRVPHLDALGLGEACRLATGRIPPGLNAAAPTASCGIAVERSTGKDTPSGHWELAGTPVAEQWGYLPRQVPCLPSELSTALIEQAALPGLLGQRHDSGEAVIEVFGEEHLRTGKPIVYTSVDSVMQIAAHEEVFGLERLYEVCRIARRLSDPLRIGRVIARPFTGSDAASFRRTPHRKDFAMPPPAGTLFQRAAEAGRAVVTVGKTGDIFAHQHTGTERKGRSNDENLAFVIDALATLPDGGLIFANLVDFDTDHGHRRDAAGYADCLERFDAQLPALLSALQADDLLVITADHGNDPTAPGTDHTREMIPVLATCAARGAMHIGRRETFSDVGASVCAHLGLQPPLSGRSWMNEPSRS